MKINFFKFIFGFFFILTFSIIYLSVIGIETDKFNKQIKDKISKKNKNLDIDLKKIKLTLDPLNLKINAKTIGPKVYYSNKILELEHIKTQVSLLSIMKNRFVSSNFEIGTRSILVKDFIKFIRAINNTTNLFLLEKIVNKGFVIIDLSINFDENGNIKDDYEVKGLLKDGNLKFLNNTFYNDINFRFNLKKDNFNFQKISFNFDKINFLSNSLRILKKKNIFFLEGTIENKNSKLTSNVLNFINFNTDFLDIENSYFETKNNFSFELDNSFKLKNLLLKSNIKLDNVKYKTEKFIHNYLSKVSDTIIFKDHELKLDYNKNQLSIQGEGKIKINEKFEKIDYLVDKKKDGINLNSNLIIENIDIKKQEFLKDYFPLLKENINLKNHKINIVYNNKNLTLSGEGKIRIDKVFEYTKYQVSTLDKNHVFDIDLGLTKTNFKIDFLNYSKKHNTNAKLKFQGEFIKNKNLNIKNFTILENNNKIEILNLLLGDKYLISKIEKAKFNYIDSENKKNNFIISKRKKNDYEINGKILNANLLISNILEDDDQNEKKIFEHDINLNLKLDKVYIDEIYFVENLYGQFLVRKNKVEQANISALFNRKEKISLTINTNKEDVKITTLNSTWAKPLVNRYKFIKGFEEGYLDFYSSKKNGISNSVLIIDNFRVKEVPALAKLLALASLQGIADLLTGEGIRFTDLEMKYSNNKKLMTIDELYAIGPSISLLMEGYIQSKELISLRGTLVPASTINRSIASIPLLGDLLVGKKVGEGIFGVSFKIKGPPKNLETTVNPIKTLTPRFISRTLDKIKKN